MMPSFPHLSLLPSLSIPHPSPPILLFAPLSRSSSFSPLSLSLPSFLFSHFSPYALLFHSYLSLLLPLSLSLPPFILILTPNLALSSLLSPHPSPYPSLFPPLSLMASPSYSLLLFLLIPQSSHTFIPYSLFLLFNPVHSSPISFSFPPLLFPSSFLTPILSSSFHSIPHFLLMLFPLFPYLILILCPHILFSLPCLVIPSKLSPYPLSAFLLYPSYPLPLFLFLPPVLMPSFLSPMPFSSFLYSCMFSFLPILYFSSPLPPLILQSSYPGFIPCFSFVSLNPLVEPLIASSSSSIPHPPSSYSFSSSSILSLILPHKQTRHELAKTSSFRLLGPNLRGTRVRRSTGNSDTVNFPCEQALLSTFMLAALHPRHCTQHMSLPVDLVVATPFAKVRLSYQTPPLLCVEFPFLHHQVTPFPHKVRLLKETTPLGKPTSCC
ncbi:hypothetical protein C7M84_023969 [Penaeus vannamei]|uniref:Uncharacterized protein n=1 Tax=Penaeus vannamei TaxID=6689 RepID=A0A3R7Q0K8_PENVA|nr:hypothetical protein C7M84_023969 [Penaeus vannamei]